MSGKVRALLELEILVLGRWLFLLHLCLEKDPFGKIFASGEVLAPFGAEKFVFDGSWPNLGFASFVGFWCFHDFFKLC